MADIAFSQTLRINPELPLDEQRELLLAVLESVPGLFFLLDRNGRFCGWNSQLEEVTGYSSAEIAVLNPLDLLEPELHAAFREAIDGVFRDGRGYLEGSLRTRMGLSPPYSYYGRRVMIGGRPMVAGMGLDASKLKEAQHVRFRQARQLHHLARHVPGVIYQLRHDTVNNQFSMPFASAKLAEVLGVELDHVCDDARILFDRIYERDRERVMQAVASGARKLTSFHQQFRLIGAEGDPDQFEWIEVESSPEQLEDGVVLWHGFARLITQRKLMEEKLTRLAYYDPLTGLANRALLQGELDRLLKQAMSSGSGLAVLHLDLDNFKDINDVWGHSTGDRLLIEVASVLNELVDERSVIGRVGGDDFLVILRGCEVATQAERIAETLCAAMNCPLAVDDRLFRITASVGISLFPKDGQSAEDLVRHADAALYRAKADGPGSWARYSPELTAAAMARRYLETELRIAVEKEQIRVALQPIVHLADGRAAGYEALARWHHSGDGWIDPEQFIEMAENRGLVGPLSEQVYRQAMHRVADMPAPIFLAINVAPVQLRSAQFVNRLLALARECAFSPERLEVEITERAFLEPIDEILKQIHLLRRHGVSISIDDFGTGYSSLAYFRTLPIQRLKIDQIFVRQIEGHRENAAIVKAAVTLASELGIAVTAEGVQTEAERSFMQQAGCTFAQGWYFGRAELLDEQARTKVPWRGYSSRSSSSQAS